MIHFETRVDEQKNKYIVFNDHWIPESSIKFILMFWIFCSVTFFAYLAGMQDQQNSMMLTAYMSQGKLMNVSSGQYMYCQPLLINKNIKWECNESNSSVIT
jgi:hypothetical protein